MSLKTSFTVTDLNRVIKTTLEETKFFERVSVHGELSNLTKAISGHWYFTLKDSTSRLTCVMFSSAVRHLGHSFKEGDQVELVARVTFYEPGGTLQLNVSHMQLFGIGSLFAKLEALRLQLQKEGLFDSALKKPLPKYPRSIGVITSLGSAAHADILKTLKTRWPVATVQSYGTLVQGEGSVNEIMDALKRADQGHHDVLILARGGGSIEDLWSFNHELLVRLISTLKTPIISGVGHESDTTLVDYVVDVRGPTPTGAATLATPLIQEVLTHFDQLSLRLNQIMESKLNYSKTRLNHQSLTLQRLSPQKLVEKRHHLLENAKLRLEQSIKRPQDHQRLSKLYINFNHSIQSFVETHKYQINTLQHQLYALDIMQPLKRGYAFIYHDDKPITSIKDLSLSQSISLKIHDGDAQAIIQTIKENNHD
ncbi:MAG: exodeoxyribonuclease VII large subunit [Erysipelothrix sp.]|jgi:exodeoxyribonuclease VII large subunit|nr:exodeoxyribonuclease VII large subunit [Erysipelothrix sp.]